MDKIHISEDGMPRVCKARSVASCPVKGPDGDRAPHGEFESKADALRFAESVNAKAFEKKTRSKVAPRSKIEDTRNAKAVAAGALEDISVYFPDFDFEKHRYEAYLKAYEAYSNGEDGYGAALSHYRTVAQEA